MHANCVGEARFASTTSEDNFANFVKEHQFVHMIVKSTSVSSVLDQPSVFMSDKSIDANIVEALEYANMGEKRQIASHVEVKPCVSTENSSMSAVYVKVKASVLKNVQSMVG